MSEVYEILYNLVSTGDTSEATLAAFYDVAIDCDKHVLLCSCQHCKSLCDPEHGACHCPCEDAPFQGEWPDDNRSLSRCSQCSALYDRDLRGGCPWCYETSVESPLLQTVLTHYLLRRSTMNELYEELYDLVVTGQDQEDATLAALHDVAMDLNVRLHFQSCTRCRAMCVPDTLHCYCLHEEEYEEDSEYEGDHDLLPGELWCCQCAIAFNSELHGPWCPHCHGLPIEDTPESPIQTVPNEEPQQFPMTEDDDIPF